MENHTLDISNVKLIFDESGISVAEWARVNGFSSSLVYQVLDGSRKCLRGQSHQIAIALGIKRGEEMNVKELSQKLRASVSAFDGKAEEYKM